MLQTGRVAIVGGVQGVVTVNEKVELYEVQHGKSANHANQLGK